MIHIITGSTLGGAEYVGDHLSDLLVEQGVETTIHNQPDISQIKAQGTWLIITSTHGAGDYPDNIEPFMTALKTAPPKMSDVKFAVIAIGDSSYDTFCGAGKEARATLLDIGAEELCPHLEIDILETPVPEDAAETWIKHNIAVFID
ncbi:MULTISPECIES: FMN-binding protein MioC [Vibrio]|uniref:FMN-binding protein MioC n=1 Tax=Vibrio casei TaxID=673372 RepID=A0A368LK22_9VIBR|nr:MULTISPECIES: FMN-binding protein MioC [Vibrio]RCS72188.1 FMN-binding protein MioC [Vibrio casei]SJN21699.1 Flavoprotein MioC [Vibrio casei]HBV76506.1 FMN-binding protein MioC [Vibrio sp.]